MKAVKPRNGPYLDGVLVLHLAEVVDALLVLVRRLRGRRRRRGVGPSSGLTRGAGRRSGVSLHQEGDGGGGAGKERYCLVMSGLCHVYTIDLDRQQNQRRRGVSAHREALNNSG